MNDIKVAKEIVRIAKQMLGYVKHWSGEEHTLEELWVGDLPVGLRNEVMKKFSEGTDPKECFVSITFESEGYYDSGRRGLDPDDSYPPEEDDKRTLVSVSVSSETEEFGLSGPLERRLFNHFKGEIDDMDLHHDYD